MSEPLTPAADGLPPSTGPAATPPGSGPAEGSAPAGSVPVGPGAAGPGAAGSGAAPDGLALREELRIGATVLVVLGLVGVPVGLLWSAVAPRADVVPAAGGGLDFADSETKDFIAGDGLLFLLGLLAGVVSALVVWRLTRQRPLGALLGLVLGAGLGAWVAARTGTAGGDREALLAAARAGRLSGRAELPLQLHADSVLYGWPGAAAGTWALLALRQRGRERRAAVPAGPPGELVPGHPPSAG